MSDDDEGFFEASAKMWIWLGAVLHKRPAQFVSYLVAALVVIVLLSLTFVRTTENKTDINQVKDALCNSPGKTTSDVVSAHQLHQCQKLFDRLLRNPTQPQIERLRQLVKGK